MQITCFEHFEKKLHIYGINLIWYFVFNCLHFLGFVGGR